MAKLIKKAVDNTQESVDNTKVYTNRRKEMDKMDEATRKEDVIDAIKRAFRADLESEEIEQSDYNRGESPWGYGYSFEGDANNRESKWVVFTSDDKAYDEAYAYVKNMLEDEPKLFSKDWLENFIYITDTDRRLIAGEDAEMYFDGMGEEQILEEGDMIDEYNDLEEEIDKLQDEQDKLTQEIRDTDDQITMSNLTDQINNLEIEVGKKQDEQLELIDKAREEGQENHYDLVYDQLEDPIQFFVHEVGYYTVDDLLEQSFIQIDIEKATEDALKIDGVAHFLDGYDGEEEEITDPETGDTFYAYGTN